MNIFISQVMKDRTESDIREERYNIINEISERFKNFKVLDSYFDDFDSKDTKNKPLVYLARSLSMMADADLAVFGKGWEKGRGCRVEHLCAQEYGIEILDMNEVHNDDK